MGALEQAKAAQSAEAFEDRLVVNRTGRVISLCYRDPSGKGIKRVTVHPYGTATISKQILRALHDGPGAAQAKAILKMLDPISPGQLEEIEQEKREKAQAAQARG